MLTTYCLRFGKNNWIYHKLNNLVGLEFLCKCSQRKNQYFMDGWMWKCLPVEKKLAAWMNEGEHFFLLFSGSFILSVLLPSKRFPPPYLSIPMLHHPWMSKNLYGACGSRIILIFVSKNGLEFSNSIFHWTEEILLLLPIQMMVGPYEMPKQKIVNIFWKPEFIRSVWNWVLHSNFSTQMSSNVGKTNLVNAIPLEVNKC